MAINNWVDYSKIPTQKPWYDNIVDTLTQGFKAGQLPAQMGRQRQQEELLNQLKGLEVEHKPKEYQLADVLKQTQINSQKQSASLGPLREELLKAQIEKAKRPAGAMGFKPSGDVANQAFVDNLADSGASPEQIQKYQKIIDNTQRKGANAADRSAMLNNSQAYRGLPTDEKNRVDALAVGMGYDPIEAAIKLNEGVSLNDMAQEKGLKLGDVGPMYPLKGENIKQLQKRGSYVAELVDLQKNISEGLGEYRDKIGKYSFSQLKDAVTGQNIDKQARALAANALLPELSALRINVANGKVGIEAIRDLEAKSLSQLKTIEGSVSKDVYLKMQDYMNKWLIDASNAYENKMMDYGMLGNPSGANLQIGQGNNAGGNQSAQLGQSGFDFSKYPVAGGR